MPTENTQYGLKNYLSATVLEQLNASHFQCQLASDKKTLYLNIIFINEDTIRFHYSFNQNFDLNYPNQHLNFDLIQMKIGFEEDNDAFYLSSPNLEVKINKEKLAIQIFDKDSNLLSADFPQLGFWSEELENEGSEIRCYRAYEDLENPPFIYGLGDKTGPINRWSRRFRNAPIDALGYDSKETDPLYKDIPFFIDLNPKTQKAHGIFFDNFYKKTFDFGKEKKPGLYYYFSAEAGEMNYYFFNGPSIKEVVQNYLKLTGMPALMPDYALGYAASGMSYLENYGKQEKQDERVINTLKRFFKEGLQPSNFHMSSGYILNDKNERHQFIWNKDKFPEPKNFVDAIKELGVSLCANVKPVLLKTHPWYKEAQDLDIFINAQDGSTLVVDYWGGAGSYIDFRKASAQQWWSKKLEENIFAHGIEGVWNDNNEYEIFSKHQASGNEIEMSLLMSKVSFELAKKLNPDKEPWILSRSGYAGIQKYAQTWIGDNYSSWQSLKYDNAILTSMNLSGLVHCGTDIGGFFGPKPDSELFLRWIQNGIFTPRFSIHSYKEDATEPDMYKDSNPEHFKAIQEAFKLREELMPYIKEQNQKAHDEGIAIMRPLVYDFQDDPMVYAESFSYMFGDKYLVAPIAAPLSEEKEKQIYLPKGNWQHYFTKQDFVGAKEYKLENKLDYIHVFEKIN